MGCNGGEGNPAGPNPSQPLELEFIIVNPKAPAPGDTVRVTATATSSSPNIGDFPSYSWQASGGIFIENDKTSVKWVAPVTPGVYTISATASNSTGSVSRSTPVFAGLRSDVVLNRAGEMHLWPFGGGFYYLYSSLDASDPRFTGFTISMHDQNGERRLTDFLSGLEYTFSNSQRFAAFTRESNFGGTSVQSKNIRIVDLLGTGSLGITTDGSAPGSPRKHEYTSPTFSPDGQLLAYQAFRPGPQSGGVDSFDVYVYKTGQPIEQTVRTTEGHGTIRKNFYPTFSPDGNWLVFVSDRAEALKWELYGLPVTGDIVATDSSETVQFTDADGLIGSPNTFTRIPPNNPRVSWSHDAVRPILALEDATGGLALVELNGTGAITRQVSLPGRVGEFAWSHGGDDVIVSTRNAILLVSRNGTAQELVQARFGDRLHDPAWSADDTFVAYRVNRQSNMWFEILNVSDRTQISEPVSITSNATKGNVDAYRTLMNTRPVFNTDSELFVLLFDQSTPRIVKVDLSTIVSEN